MLMQEERELIVSYGKKLIEENLTAGTAGNISIYNPSLGYMAISPSGIPYFDTKAEDVVIMDLDGNKIDGKNKPSSEYGLHAVFYKIRKDIKAVVHTHSMYATTLACMGETLKSVHYAIADCGVTELPMAPFHTFGTKELAKAVEENLGDTSKAILLANHGIVCCNDTIQGAFSLAKTCEWCSEVQWRCMAAGKMNVISKKDMDETMEAYKSYGQPKEGGKGPNGYFG